MQFSFNDLKLRGFAGHTAAVRTISVNEPIKRFASGSRDRTVKIWSLNIHEGIEHWETSPYSECLMTYTGHRRGTINDVHFLPGVASGLTDIMASCDGHVHVSLRHSIHLQLLFIQRTWFLALESRNWKGDPSVQCRATFCSDNETNIPLSESGWWYIGRQSHVC